MAHAPVNSTGLVADREDGGWGVEGCHLQRGELAHGLGHQAAHPEGVAQLWLPHSRGQLAHLVSLDVDAAEDGEAAKLVLQRVASAPTGPVGVTQHGLVLEERALSLQSAGEVVDVGAAQAVAATGGPRVLAVGAADRLAPPQSQVHVDEGPSLGLIHLCGPQGTVQVNPHVQVQVEEPRWTICEPISKLVAEAAPPVVPERSRRTQRGPQLAQELVDLVFIGELRVPSRHHHLDRPLPPFKPLLPLSLVPAFVGSWPGLQLHRHLDGIRLVHLGGVPCWRKGKRGRRRRRLLGLQLG